MISQALSLLRRLNAPGWKPYSPDLSAAHDELSRSEKQAADVCFLLAWVIRFISPGSVYWEWEHIQDNTFPQCSHRKISAIPQEDPAATETLSIPVNNEQFWSAGVRLLSKLNVKRNLRTSDRSYTTEANRSTQTEYQKMAVGSEKVIKVAKQVFHETQSFLILTHIIMYRKFLNLHGLI